MYNLSLVAIIEMHLRSHYAWNRNTALWFVSNRVVNIVGHIHKFLDAFHIRSFVSKTVEIVWCYLADQRSVSKNKNMCPTLWK